MSTAINIFGVVVFFDHQVVTCPSSDMIRTRARCRNDDHWIDCYRCKIEKTAYCDDKGIILKIQEIQNNVSYMKTLYPDSDYCRDSCCPGYTLVVGRCIPDTEDPCRSFLATSLALHWSVTHKLDHLLLPQP